MRKRYASAGAVLSLTLAIYLFPIVSRAQPTHDADTVPIGPDLFATLPGTFFNIPGIGQVNFLGVPNAQGADTIIQRLAAIDVPDVIGATETVPLQMTMLDLKSTAPISIGGSFFDVFVDLTPGTTSPGTLTLTQTVNGEGVPEGTFATDLTVNFTLTFEQNGKTVPCPVANCASQLSLRGSGSWTDDLGVDWIEGGRVREQHPGGGVHMARVIPEPATLLLLGGGLLGGVLCKKFF